MLGQADHYIIYHIRIRDHNFKCTPTLIIFETMRTRHCFGTTRLEVIATLVSVIYYWRLLYSVCQYRKFLISNIREEIYSTIE